MPSTDGDPPDPPRTKLYTRSVEVDVVLARDSVAFESVQKALLEGVTRDQRSWGWDVVPGHQRWDYNGAGKVTLTVQLVERTDGHWPELHRIVREDQEALAALRRPLPPAPPF